MNIDYKVGEVKLSYKPKSKNQQKVTCSEDAYKYMLSTYKKGTICYKEYFKVLFLNQANQVLGIYSYFRGMTDRNDCRYKTYIPSCITY